MVTQVSQVCFSILKMQRFPTVHKNILLTIVFYLYFVLYLYLFHSYKSISITKMYLMATEVF